MFGQTYDVQEKGNIFLKVMFWLAFLFGVSLYFMVTTMFKMVVTFLRWWL